MSGTWDGVSKVWTMECDRGLRLDGHKTKTDAAVSLLLQEVNRDPSDAHVAAIRAAVEDALTSTEDAEDAKGEDPDATTKDAGVGRADHRGWLMNPDVDLDMLAGDPRSHSLSVARYAGGWALVCPRCRLRLVRRYQDVDDAHHYRQTADRMMSRKAEGWGPCLSEGWNAQLHEAVAELPTPIPAWRCTVMAHQYAAGHAECQCGEATRGGSFLGWRTESRLTDAQIRDVIAGNTRARVDDPTSLTGAAEASRRHRLAMEVLVERIALYVAGTPSAALVHGGQIELADEIRAELWRDDVCEDRARAALEARRAVEREGGPTRPEADASAGAPRALVGFAADAAVPILGRRADARASHAWSIVGVPSLSSPGCYSGWRIDCSRCAGSLVPVKFQDRNLAEELLRAADEARAGDRRPPCASPPAPAGASR